MSWKRTLRRIAMGAAIALVVIVAVGFFILRSRAFHRYVLKTIISKVEQSTGSRAAVGDFSFRLSGLRLDLYRVTLYGAGPAFRPPLLTVDRLSLGLRIISILGGKINLNDAEVEHPVVHVFVNKLGTSNIPHPSAPSKKPVDVFKLAVRNVRLDRGEIYYNNVRKPLNASLHNLRAQVRFAASKTAYDGTLAYRQGTIQFGDFNPVQHNLDAAFIAAPQGVNLTRLVITSGASRISAQARLVGYRNPVVTGSYQAVISTTELRHILRTSTLPAGEILAVGSMRYQKTGNQPVLDCVQVDGQISSLGLRLRGRQAQVSVRDATAEYHFAKGNLTVRNARADILGGRLIADVSVQHVTTAPSFRVLATVRAISLRAINAALAAKPDIPIQGEISGRLVAAWSGNIRSAQAHSDITIQANTIEEPQAATGEGSIPVEAAVHLTYDGTRGLLTFSQSTLRAPHTDVQLNGTLSSHSQLSIDASTTDLHEIDVLALSFRRARASGPVKSPPQLWGLHGSASLMGQVQGSTGNPRFAGGFTASNLRVRNIQARLARAQITLSRSSVALSQGRVELDRNSSVRFSVTAGLKNWSYLPSNPINAQISAARVPLRDLEQAANLNLHAAGVLDANIAVHGSRLNPAGQGTVRITKAEFYNQPVQDVSIQFHGTGTAMHSSINVRTAAGNASWNFTYDVGAGTYDTQFAARNIALGRLEAVKARGLGISGSLSLTAQGRGTFKSPQLQASAEIPDLAIRQQHVAAVKANVNIAHQHANFTLTSGISNAQIKASGSVSLKPDYDLTAELDTQTLQLGPELANFLPVTMGGLHAEAAIHASLNGPLKYPARMQAQAVIPIFSMSYQPVKLAATRPIHITYSNGTVVLQPAEIKGTGTDLRLHGTIPLQGLGPMKVSVLGTMNLAALGALNPEGSSSGQLKLQITARGSRFHPEVTGDVRIINAVFQSPMFPVGIEKLNGDLTLDNHQLRIRQFTGTAGGGTISASGGLAFRPKLQFNFGITASRVAVRYQNSVRAVVNSNLSLAGAPQSSTLSGRVVIDRLSLTPSFGLATFASQMGGGPSLPSSQGFMSNLRLNIAVSSARELSVQSNMLSIQGATNLNIRGTAAEPVVLGRATLAGGEVDFLNHRYQIQRGSIAFVNPARTEPIVNLRVTTTVDQYDLRVNLEGPVDHLRTSYTSDPPLPPVDVINLLVRGQTTEQAAAQP
ncbi:MAG: translocation/assembly module TamB domain-containing protein, partial [Terriglobia bacterium]